MKITSSKNNFQFSDNEYAYLTMSATQNTDVAVNNPIKFNIITGNVTLAPATYTWTLKKNRTYHMLANAMMQFSNSSGGASFRFYDVTNSAWLGMNGYFLPVSYAANNSSTSGAFVIVTPATDINVQLRLSDATNISNIYNTYTWCEIQQINIVSPVIPDPSRSLAYISPPIALTVSGQAGFSLIRGIGQFYKASDGGWWVKGNICATQTLGTNGSVTITGVVFKNIANYYQAVNTTYPAVTTYAFASPNTSTITITYSGNKDYVVLSFDLELNAKPTGYGLPTDI